MENKTNLGGKINNTENKNKCYKQEIIKQNNYKCQYSLTNIF